MTGWIEVNNDDTPWQFSDSSYKNLQITPGHRFLAMKTWEQISW